jgi:hypothetical protein
MKKFSQLIAVIGLSILLFSACNKEQSLQEYIVENQENSNFLSIDIPANVLQLNEDASSESKETLASLKKLNVIAFKINDANKDDYTTELQKVKAILKNDKFTELVRMKHDNASIQVKYLGSEDAIDEIILFASEQTKGFAVARVLGKNMQPEKMMKLIQNMDEMKKDSPVFAQIEGLLGEMK